MDFIMNQLNRVPAFAYFSPKNDFNIISHYVKIPRNAVPDVTEFAKYLGVIIVMRIFFYLQHSHIKGGT